MGISGHQYFNGKWQAGTDGIYQAINPSTGEPLAPVLSRASRAQVSAAVSAAQAALGPFQNTPPADRARFLETIAEEIMALGDALTQRVSAETGYPLARAEGERARTCGQLQMFARYVAAGEHFDARIDTADPARQPLPKPDIRYMNQALGPVVVFGASNFPLAFSVAGGDTASALAAGCPVLVKGHSSHPGSCELVAQAIARAAEKTAMPAGVFSLLMGEGRTVGSALVSAPEVKAVGFTGSFSGGMALYRLANERPEPIPVFAEMGSVNPVVVLPQALATNADAIARGFVASLTLGTGQFCVNPGLLLAIKGPSLEAFINATNEALAATASGIMLNQRICEAYQEGLDAFKATPGVEALAEGVEGTGEGYHCQAALLKTSAKTFLHTHNLHEEIFGPTSLVVECDDHTELLAVLNSLRGQLTGTVHAGEGELEQYPGVVDVLRARVGRLVFNGFPTGVEVCPSMVHGGPFPAATDARFTSVGTAAIERFLRPVCFQDVPDAYLPEALKNNNPLGLTRLINGERSQKAL
ncbi:MAG TPA: aldehyde dehydrogenase (NADP(+)) [Cellvibrionaceae bacterium]